MVPIMGSMNCARRPTFRTPLNEMGLLISIFQVCHIHREIISTGCYGIEETVCKHAPSGVHNVCRRYERCAQCGRCRRCAQFYCVCVVCIMWTMYTLWAV